MGKISVEKFSAPKVELWDDFVDQSFNGTIFNKQQFLSYHDPNRFKDNSLLFLENGNVFSVFTANIYQEDFLISHQGASFGGFVYKNLSLENALKLCTALVNYAKENKIKYIKMTEAPVIYSHPFNQNMHFALIKNGFTITQAELTSVVQLDFLKVNILESYNPKARTNVKKAIKEKIEISFSDDFSAFYTMMLENFNSRHGIKPTHSLQEILKLREIFPENILLLAAFKDQVMIAGSLLFICNPRVLMTFYLVNDFRFQILRPLNLLVYELTKWAVSKNFRFIDFGTITSNMEINKGLTQFKENFSATGVFRNSLEISL